MPLASLLLAGVVALAAPAADPVMRYDGAWTVRSAKGAEAHLVNRCFQGATFVACEQAVDGKVGALLTFRLVSVKDGVRDYTTSPVPADGSRPAAPQPFRIEGEHWVYSFETTADGKTHYGRVQNDFSGPDRIRYTIQSSPDGKTWTTDAGGEEIRAAP